MSPRSRLIFLAAVAGASLGGTTSAMAQAVDDRGHNARPAIERATPAEPRSANEQNAAPQPPLPVIPGGCPFRDNKLELIV